MTHRRPVGLKRQLDRLWEATEAAPGGSGTIGPKGDKGDPGDTGPAGPTGPAGAPGQQGTTGTTGLKGDTGNTGPQGLKGDSGNIGPQGDQGPIGLTGPKGDKGDKGDPGNTGPQGETGPQGPTGAASNVAGPQGQTGPQGIKGDTGDQGPQGDIGPQGPAGVGADPWTYLKLANDFTTNSATAVDITGLAFTPTANLTYEFEAHLMCRTATATIGPRPGLAWPTGGADGTASIYTPSSGTAETMVHGNIAAALLAAVGGLPTTTGSYGAKVQGIFKAGASPSGTVKLQLASETAGTNVIAKAGSFLKYRTI